MLIVPISNMSASDILVIFHFCSSWSKNPSQQPKAKLRGFITHFSIVIIKKEAANKPGSVRKINLSLMIIYLGWLLPTNSSGLPGNGGQP